MDRARINEEKIKRNQDTLNFPQKDIEQKKHEAYCVLGRRGSEARAEQLAQEENSYKIKTKEGNRVISSQKETRQDMDKKDKVGTEKRNNK